MTANSTVPIFYNKNAGDPTKWTYEPDVAKGPAANRNSLKDFFFRSKLPISEDQLLQENPKFWQLLESTTSKRP